MSLSVSIKKSFPAFTLDVDIEAGNETTGWANRVAERALP